jgi:hypothetical protein
MSHTCEICAVKTDSFGDLQGSIICGDCLGWNPDKPMAPHVKELLIDVEEDDWPKSPTENVG